MKFTLIGGRLMPPIDLSIAGVLPVSDEDVARNIRNAFTLDLPNYREMRARKPRLAVVGGGPSINSHIDELKAWDGDIWAINGAFGWCDSRGIDAVFLAVDPHPIVAKWARGARRALLETRCDPSAFDELKDADVYLFDIGTEGGIAARGSTATAAPHLAIRMGYREVTFFGCESSYPPGASHAYRDEAREDQLIVEVGGVDYLTAPDFHIQAEELSNYIRQIPEFLKERSGGLLRAMLEHPNPDDRHIRWISESFAKGLTMHEQREAA